MAGQQTAAPASGTVDPWGLRGEPFPNLPVCGGCSGAGQVAVRRDPDGALVLATCTRCNGTGEPRIGGAA